MEVRQVQPHDRFPSGDSRALVELRFNPQELSALYSITFEALFDDLDWFERAAIVLPDGSQVWLTRYRGEQDAGTTVYVDVGADPLVIKEELARTLRLGDADFAWVAPDLVAHSRP